MKDEKYSDALVMYNRAITIDASNPVFYCNRAAAYSRLGDYQKAVDDCKMSLRFDNNYGKAYGRLGLAYSKLNRYQQALEAYENAVRIEPDNTDYQTNMRITQQKFDEAKSAPNLSAAVGAAAGGVPGGLPNLDFAAALNNPALVSMASRMMTDPSIQSMLSQLSGMNNVDALIETGRQLAMQMNTQNPDLVKKPRFSQL
jgi:small glutamine-rich tetratricopeptide repeat-containing protein alpha